MKKVEGLASAFGKIIAQERQERGLSQEQLAEAIDSNNVYICLLENGQRQPSLNATILLAQALGMRPDILLGNVCSYLEREQR